MEVNPDYHPKIIGRRGAVVMKIRQDHDVQINLLKKGEPNDNIITITGYEENCHKAQEDIMKIVSELVCICFLFLQSPRNCIGAIGVEFKIKMRCCDLVVKSNLL